MVLLKNDDSILPIKQNVRIAVIGEMAKKPRYQGAGSSQVTPTQVDTFIDEAQKANLQFTYAQGYDKEKDKPNNKLIKQAKEVAENADVVLLFIGLPERYEAEAMDRPHMKLPPCHDVLVDAVCQVNSNVVVILSGGAPVEMPWINKVKGLLNASLAGQAGAGAIVDIITGRVNPSGKLSETYPKSINDVPCADIYGMRYAPLYKESIYVGYRYYDTVNKDVLFPFGYGLSYTTFEYSNIHTDFYSETGKLVVSFTVKNTGTKDGAEVAEVYVHQNNGSIFRPQKELKGFEKVYLNSGEEKSINMELDKRAFSYYNTNTGDWYAENGEYEILVGSSSRDIRLFAKLSLKFSEKTSDVPNYRETAPLYYTGDVKNVPDEQFEAIYGKTLPQQTRDVNAPLDFNSTFNDSKDVPAARMLKAIVRKAVELSAPNKAQGKVAVNSVMSIPFRLIISMSQGVISKDIAQGIIDILDGKGVVKPLFRIMKGLAKTIKYIPKLLNTVS